MTAAIIIARGGSKRLPRKNVLKFCGHPLIAWSIGQARTAELVDRVIMCTDDDEIEDISNRYGAEVIRHPEWPENAMRTFRWALDKAGITDGEFLSILPTSPLRAPGDIDFGIRERRRLDLQHIGAAVVFHQICFGRIIGKHQWRREIHAKNSDYALGSMGFGIWRVRYYLANPVWPDDMPIEKYEKMSVDNLVPGEGWWYECEWWKQFETDTAAEFEFCEMVMEHYILRGRKIDEVYK